MERGVEMPLHGVAGRDPTSADRPRLITVKSEAGVRALVGKLADARVSIIRTWSARKLRVIAGEPVRVVLLRSRRCRSFSFSSSPRTRALPPHDQNRSSLPVVRVG